MEKWWLFNGSSPRYLKICRQQWCCTTRMASLHTRCQREFHRYQRPIKNDPKFSSPPWVLPRKLLNTIRFHAEINMKKSGRVEYMYINVNEEIEIKLTAQHFKKMSCTNDKCTNDDLHSAVQCVERCFWRQVTEKIKCRGPWMPGLDIPLCNNYTSMRKLFINYEK